MTSTSTSTGPAGGYKSSKKLQVFFKEKEKSSKRYKSCLSWIESPDITEEDEKKFFSDNYDAIFAVTYDRFVQYEDNWRKGKALKDLLSLFGVLRKIIIYLAPLINSRWNLDNIGMIIEKSLLKSNHQSVRLTGFELLLYFIEALQNSIGDSQIKLFESAINLQPFVTPDTKVNLRPGAVILPSISRTSSQETLSGTSPSSASRLRGTISRSMTLSLKSPNSGRVSFDSKMENVKPTNSDDGNDCRGETGEALYPAADSPSKQDSIELLDYFLDFITNKSNNFLFWFNLFKDKYLKLFYPVVFEEMRLLDKSEEVGFRTLCPPEIQAAIIDRILTWGDRPQIFSTVWDPYSNGPIMLEIHRHTCLLPLSFATTVKKSMQVFRSWLMNFQKNKIFSNQLQEYWQKFIKALALVFSLPCTMEEVEVLHSLCREILIVYTYFVVELSHKLSKETWETLQYTVLLTSFDLVNRSLPESSSTVTPPAVISSLLKKQAPNPLSKNGKHDTFADHLFGALYFFWIRSGITTEDMWRDMSKKVTFCTDWQANVRQWKEKVIQLTYILRDYLYVIPAGSQAPTTTRVEKTALTSSTDDEGGIRVSKIMDETAFIRSTGKAIKKGSEDNSDFDMFEFIRDPRLMTISWTNESVKSVWYTLLNVLGNPTKISTPASYAIAMSCIYEVVEILVDAEEKQPLKVAAPIPIMKVFLPWLIEACTYDEQLLKGLLIAYRTVLTLFSRRHNVSDELSHLLTHFYRIIQMGLNSDNAEVVREILEYSTSIFCYDLPGVAVLIPDFLREIEGMWTSNARRDDIPTAVKQNALTIVNSLICYPNHFDGLDFPVAEIIKPYETISKEPFITSAGVKDKISKILIMVFRSFNEDPNTYLIALCGATVLLYEEMENPEPRVEILNKFLKYYLEFSEHPEDIVSQAALECLAAVAELHGKIAKLDRSVVVTLISNTCDQIVKMMKKEKIRENVVVNLLLTLRDWLLSAPNDILTIKNDKALVLKIFSSLEITLLGDLMDLKNARTPPELLKEQENVKKKKLKNVLPNKPQDIFDLFEEWNQTPLHGSTSIREAAESVLSQLHSFYNHFPSQLQTENGHPQEDEIAFHFALNECLILSMYEAENVGKIMIRDGMGKTYWDSSLVTDTSKRKEEPLSPSADKWGYKPNANSAAPRSRFSTLRNTESFHNTEMQAALVAESIKEPTKENTVAPIKVFERKEQEMPKYKEGIHFTGVDMVNQLLQYLSETLPASESTSASPFPEPKTIGKPDAIDASFALLISSQITTLETQSHYETVSTKERKALPSNRTNIVSLSSFHTCRLLLSQMGILGQKLSDKFTLLDSSPQFLKHLHDYDLLNPRDTHKIALLYVAPGQEEQKDILRNEKGSDLYIEFTQGIGWFIDLNSHVGFNGGLDRSLKYAPYYCNPTMELIYHVATLLPSSVTDDKQMEKKTYIGNDYVHVVWSEHKRDYKPTTMGSQSIDAHIVVYPLPNGLFRIQIFRRQKIPFFGLLLDGMVVDKKILCSLVRQTAVNANNRAKNMVGGQKKPLSLRMTQLKELIQKNKSDRSLAEFFTSLYPVKSL